MVVALEVDFGDPRAIAAYIASAVGRSGSAMKVFIVRDWRDWRRAACSSGGGGAAHERPAWQIDWVVDPRWAPLLVDEAGTGPLVNHVHLAETKAMDALAGFKRYLAVDPRASPATACGRLRSGRRSARHAALRCHRAHGRPAAGGVRDPRESLAAKLYGLRLQRIGVHVVEQGAALLSAATQTPLTPGAALLPLEPQAELWAADDGWATAACVLAPGAGLGSQALAGGTLWRACRTARTKLGYSVVVNAPSDGDPLAGAGNRGQRRQSCRGGVRCRRHGRTGAAGGNGGRGRFRSRASGGCTGYSGGSALWAYGPGAQWTLGRRTQSRAAGCGLGDEL